MCYNNGMSTYPNYILNKLNNDCVVNLTNDFKIEVSNCKLSKSNFSIFPNNKVFSLDSFDIKFYMNSSLFFEGTASGVNTYNQLFEIIPLFCKTYLGGSLRPNPANKLKEIKLEKFQIEFKDGKILEITMSGITDSTMSKFEAAKFEFNTNISKNIIKVEIPLELLKESLNLFEEIKEKISFYEKQRILRYISSVRNSIKLKETGSLEIETRTGIRYLKVGDWVDIVTIHKDVGVKSFYNNCHITKIEDDRIYFNYIAPGGIDKKRIVLFDTIYDITYEETISNHRLNSDIMDRNPMGNKIMDDVVTYFIEDYILKEPDILNNFKTKPVSHLQRMYLPIINAYNLDTAMDFPYSIVQALSSRTKTYEDVRKDVDYEAMKIIENVKKRVLSEDYKEN